MGLFNWLKQKRAGKENVALEISKDEEELSGLNLKSAIEAHMAWRQRLTKVLDGTSTEHLEAAEIGRSDLCVLGKWINSTGEQSYGRLEEYRNLMKTHSHFHETAASVLMTHNSGKSEQASRLLDGDFKRLSEQVQLALVGLFVKAKS
ncbi:MAG: CZB domain-containing protein [Candidatus Competibacteraceae bacterium]|nr:CZB domain-containing protein [Candidatus Competibacteraceae bacterium]